MEADDEARAEALRALQDAGHTVLDARGPDQAARTAEAFGVPIHVLMAPLDWGGIGGPELARRLAPAHPGLRAVYLARDGRLPSPLPSEPGCRAVMPASCHAAALVRKVREALDAG